MLDEVRRTEAAAVEDEVEAAADAEAPTDAQESEE
jgi:hypothetical protein